MRRNMGSVISFFRVVRSGIEAPGTLDGYPYGEGDSETNLVG